MDVKEATAQGKATSLFQGMGAQFGAQIWRMAHEAKVGDYIYLEGPYAGSGHYSLGADTKRVDDVRIWCQADLVTA